MDYNFQETFKAERRRHRVAYINESRDKERFNSSVTLHVQEKWGESFSRERPSFKG